MAISSFYGLQTSLRGLIAQQRLLDTTGHNIANASTDGYSRQQVTLAASAALQVQTSGSANSVGGHLGSGVDVTGYRRVRDQFADLQYRGQNTGLAQQKARAEGLDSAELALNEPGDSGVSAQLGKFWTAWTNLSKNPADPSAKQALVGQAQSLTDSVQSVRSQLVSAQGAAQDQYDSITGTGGDIAQAATELAGLNKSISSFLVNGDAPNDLMDRRDMLLDQLSGYGQISVEKLDSGSVNVSFVDSSTGTTYPIVSDQTAAWSGPPAGDWSPGGQLGGLLSIAKTPGGSIDGYLSQLDSFSTNLASAVNSAYGGSFFTTGTPAGATIQVDPALVASPASITAGSGAGGANDIANAVAALRGNGSVDGAYKSFVTKIGSDVAEATRLQANAQVLTDSAKDRRESVSGVSMDEEMSSLVQFQRAYQASSRAMSTMDEMLDVLINRTGKVGL
jgi:flagellar hook-associated protein 1 FlgK